MTVAAYRQVIAAPSGERLDLFLTTANRLGTTISNVEKDFWVCWTLNAFYHERPAGGPRLLLKGGTSLSKAYGLIKRFPEDIDVTVFRDDLNEAASVEELEALSNKKRRARLDAIRTACRTYITGPLHEFLSAQLADATGGNGRVEIDEADPDGQTLIVRYPEAEPRDDAYVRPARCSPAGRLGRVTALLRPALPALFGGRKSGSCRSRSRCRSCTSRAHVLRPPRL